MPAFGVERELALVRLGNVSCAHLDLLSAAPCSCATPSQLAKLQFVQAQPPQTPLNIVQPVKADSEGLANPVHAAGGYIQPKKIIPGWWIWAYWINPMAWAQQSLAINEFKCAAVPPAGVHARTCSKGTCCHAEA